MARTSKSPKAVLLAALATAREALPLYSHRHSPKKFTQHQLFACLVLKCFLKTDYRGVVAHLADCPSLAEAIELSSIPHYTTLQKAARRLLAAASARRLLDATVREQLGRKRRIRRSAIDSTGLEASAASGYFIRRRDRVGTPWKTVLYHRFPKLGVVCDVETHFILAAQEGQGPRPDIADFQPLVLACLRVFVWIALSPTPATTRSPITPSPVASVGCVRSSRPSTVGPPRSQRGAIIGD